MGRAVPLGVALLLVVTGCASPVTSPGPVERATDATRERPATATGSDGRGSPSTVRPVHTPALTPTSTATPVSLASTGVPCDEDFWIGFWRPHNDMGGWTGSTVRVSYRLPANTDIFLVAYVDGEIAGVSFDADLGNGSYHVDGLGVDLRREFTGPHLVQVVVYTDRDLNRQFDPSTDRPCLTNGTVLQAGPSTLNFSQYETDTPAGERFSVSPRW
jgi:hypothetical protein